ncbi:MAG: carboxymuconolactone decarboxylase family protein [Pseudomonadota bacterium]
MTDHAERLTAAKQRVGAFSKSAGKTMQGFAAIAKAVAEPGEFSAAQKELIAVALSVSKGCEDCILYHLSAAKRLGATEAALVEALEVAVEMGGGPAVMYGSRALAAFRAL